MAVSVAPLPPYPSGRSRASLSPSQQATLNQTIASSLAQTLTLPSAQRDNAATCAFVSSYAKDIAQQVLQSLIWDEDGAHTKLFAKSSQVERSIRQRVFLLAEKQAAVGTLDLQSLLDLSVAYTSTNPTRLRSLFSSVFSQKTLISEAQDEALPAFTEMLSTPSQGLYGLRKIAHIILCLLRPAPADLAREFARSKVFVLALAKAYDHGLLAIAQSYGGLRLESHSGALDQWERIFLETKVALIDSFHILTRTLLADVAAVSSAGAALAAQCEHAFEAIFALLELQPSRPAGDGTTPFLDRTLLADYQHAYALSRTLSDVLRRADDARTELLEAALGALDSPSVGADAPGALRLILSSSGVPPGIDNRGVVPAHPANAKGKGKALAPPAEDDGALDIAVSKVLDIFPDQPPVYIRFLLSHSDYPYRGNAEKLIEVLLDGTAPTFADVEAAMGASEYNDGGAGHVSGIAEPSREEFVYTKQRRNVFDDERMDLSQIRVGKRDDASGVLQDRWYMEQMKADILRRVEQLSDSEDEAEHGSPEGKRRSAGKGEGRDVAFEDELDDGGVVRVRDGEESEDGQDEDEDDGGEDGGPSDGPGKMQPETVLELAYLQDPKLFDRDSQTRRNKARADLKMQTGWADEQIEGWKIMLEKNPKKDRILAKHEFSGNTPMSGPVGGPSNSSSGREGGARGRGGRGSDGRGRGRGSGGAGRGGGNGAGGGSTRGRASKDRNKASRGNHDRKRGYDKKMARAGGPS